MEERRTAGTALQLDPEFVRSGEWARQKVMIPILSKSESTGRRGGFPHGFAGLWCQVRLGFLRMHQAGGDPKNEDAAQEEAEDGERGFQRVERLRVPADASSGGHFRKGSHAMVRSICLSQYAQSCVPGPSS